MKSYRGNKYGAKRSVYKGVTFHSMREAEYAREIDAAIGGGDISIAFRLLLNGRKISAVEYQPRFNLIPKPNKIDYIGDFRITFADGSEEIWDVKGFETEAFKLKKKMFAHFYPQLKLVLVV